MIPNGAVFGLIGHPITHSLSPLIWSTMFRLYNVDATYKLFPLSADTTGDQLAHFIRQHKVYAVNLTVPHKQRLLPHLKTLSADALRAGAVNFVRLDKDTLHGHITDGTGFLLGLRTRGWALERIQKVVILGAGGSARAIAAALAERARHIILLNRSQTRTAATVQHLRHRCAHQGATFAGGALSTDDFAQHAVDAQLVINCTGAGARATITSFDPTILPPESAWCDINYWDDAPPLLAEHQQRGLNTDRGLSMLIAQAMLAFSNAHGCAPDPSRVFDALLDELPHKPC